MQGKIINVLLAVCVLLIVHFAFRKFDSYKEEESRQKHEEKLLETWDVKTVAYFKDFNCFNLNQENKEVKITKFITVNQSCEPDENVNMYDALKGYFTKYIDSANTIIKINLQPGKIEAAKYQRLTSRIVFIEKESKTIFKVIYVDYEGEVPQKPANSKTKVLFGQVPNEKIKLAILKEIKR